MYYIFKYNFYYSIRLMTLIKKIIFEKKNFSNQEKKIVSQFKKYGIVVIKDFFKKKTKIFYGKNITEI
jgi:hypothetical protein